MVVLLLLHISFLLLFIVDDGKLLPKEILLVHRDLVVINLAAILIHFLEGLSVLEVLSGDIGWIKFISLALRQLRWSLLILQFQSLKKCKLVRMIQEMKLTLLTLICLLRSWII